MDEPILVRPSELRRIFNEQFQAVVAPLFETLTRRSDEQHAEHMRALAKLSAELPKIQGAFVSLKASRTNFDNYRDDAAAVDTTSSASDVLSKMANVDAAPRTQGLQVAGLEHAMSTTTTGSHSPREKLRTYRDSSGFVKSIDFGFRGNGPVRIHSLPRVGFSDSTRFFTPRDEMISRKARQPMFAHPVYSPSSGATSSSPHTPPSTPPSRPPSSPPANPASSPPSSISNNTQPDVGDEAIPPSSQNDISKPVQDVPLPGHDVHSGPRMNADHTPSPSEASDDVDMETDEVEAASDPSVPSPTSAINHGDVTMVNESAPVDELQSTEADVAPMDDSVYTTIGPNPVQHHDIERPSVDDEPVPMDEAESTAGPSAAQCDSDVLPMKTVNSRSKRTAASIKPIRGTRPPPEPGVKMGGPQSGTKRKAVGRIEVNEALPLGINTAIFSMTGSAFDTELAKALDHVARKVDWDTYHHSWLSAFSLGGLKLSHWLPRLTSRIRTMFFSERKNGQLIPKWRDGSDSEFQKQFRKVLEITMPGIPIWTFGQWIRDVMLPIIFEDSKEDFRFNLLPLALQVDTGGMSEEKLKLFNFRAPSQEKRRIGVSRIFEALLGSHLRMVLYFAQHPASRDDIPEFSKPPWKSLKQKALRMEHECALNAALKRSPYLTPYDIDAVVSSIHGYKSLTRNIAKFKSEQLSRPSDYEPPAHLLSAKAHVELFDSLHQFTADNDGVIDQTYEIRAAAIDDVSLTRETDLDVTFDQRLKNLRKIYVFLTLADDKWVAAMGSSIFSPCADEFGGPAGATFELAKRREMTIIDAMEAAAADVMVTDVKQRKTIPASATYDRMALQNLAPLIDRPTETIKELAIDAFPTTIKETIVMDPRNYQEDRIPPAVPDKGDLHNENWHTEPLVLGRPPLQRQRLHAAKKTDDDQLVRDWKFMAPLLGLKEGEKWPRAL